MDAGEVIARCFEPMIGQPCWGAANGYGSWLTFNFGNPHLEIREPKPDSELAVFRMRGVRAEGEHRLWVNMAEWLIFQDGARLAHSESDRETIGLAAATLDGQILLEARTEPNPLMTQLTFDLGGRLWVSRYQQWEPDHALWQAANGDIITALHASGRVLVERPEGDRRIQTDCGYVGRQSSASNASGASAGK